MGCAGVEECDRLCWYLGDVWGGNVLQPQAACLGFHRSQEGNKHDLENPYQDEKVQSASAFFASHVQWAAWLPRAATRQLLVSCSVSLLGAQLSLQHRQLLLVCRDLGDLLLKLTTSVLFTYK